MLELEAKISDLDLTPTEKRLFGISIGKVIAKFYENKDNLETFRKQEEKFKKEIERLEAKRDSKKKEQKG